LRIVKYPVGSGVVTRASNVLSLSTSSGTLLNSNGNVNKANSNDDHFI